MEATSELMKYRMQQYKLSGSNKCQPFLLTSVITHHIKPEHPVNEVKRKNRWTFRAPFMAVLRIRFRTEMVFASDKLNS